MTPKEAEALLQKLKKRGFITDGVREYCDACGERTQSIFKLMNARIGGRDIRWCGHCEKIRSWRRTSDDQLVEDVNFDLKKFLE
jgi:hypothetical protein